MYDLGEALNPKSLAPSASSNARRLGCAAPCFFKLPLLGNCGMIGLGV